MGRASPLQEYDTLLRTRAARALTPDETQRLDLVRDVLLELGSLPQDGDPHPVRAARVVQTLEVRFSSKEQVALAYSRDIAAGGLAITTDRPLSQGESLTLVITLPDGLAPMSVTGTVSWTKGNAAGIQFAPLSPTDDQRLKEHLLTDPSLLDRVRSLLGRQAKQVPAAATLAAAPVPAPVPPDRRVRVIVQLQDSALQQVVVELLDQVGVRGTPVRVAGEGAPVVAAVEPALAQQALGHCPATLPVVCVNVSGREALVGWLSTRNTVAFVRKPASGAAIVEAIAVALKAAHPAG